MITEEARKKAIETRRKNAQIKKEKKQNKIPQVYLTGKEVNMYDFLYPIRFACRSIQNYKLGHKLERIVINKDTWQNPKAIIEAISPYVEIIYGENPHPSYDSENTKKLDKKPRKKYIMTEEHKQALAESRKRRSSKC